MKILIVGNGGREHALAWKIAQSSRLSQLYIAPGNAGTALEGENVDIPVTDISRIVNFASQNKIDLTVVGPEAPLAAGLVDELQTAGLKVFGPSKAAAELEASKVFCKNLLRNADVPTAEFRVFREAAEALEFLEQNDELPRVVKADGLASGKGVIVCSNRENAMIAVRQLTDSQEFGSAGSQIIIEERLVGQEVSILALTDGRSIVTLPAAQDHKAAHDGDRGPNTGGMGAYSPTPIAKEDLIRLVEETVLVPTVHHMKRSRRPFKGVLYAGLMLTKQGPKVLEYNVRFGDPECQPLLMRLNSDLLDLLEATADGRLEEVPPPAWDPRSAVCVVMASEGYPGKYQRGHIIRGLEEAAKLPDVKVFHAGTAKEGENVVTNGGRVLGVTALGETISTAKLEAYKAVKCIRWHGARCRKDISDKALLMS